MTQTDDARGPEFPADWRDRAHSFKGMFKLQAAWADGFNAARDQIRADLATQPDPLADPRVTALRDAVEYILDGMAIDGPDYKIDPEDDFLDVANTHWVRDTLTRLATALAAFDTTTGGKDE